MALQQLNLKVPAGVVADWRRRAREAGHGASVRDWLLATLSPPAEAAISPSAAADLSDRLDAVEARLAAADHPSAADLLSDRIDAVEARVEAAVAALEARLAAAVAAAESLASPSPQPAASPPAAAAEQAEQAEHLTSVAVSAALAARGLAVAAGTLNRWASAHRPGDLWSYRRGGSGQWQLIGKAQATVGAPWLWQPTEGTRADTRISTR